MKTTVPAADTAPYVCDCDHALLDLATDWYSTFLEIDKRAMRASLAYAVEYYHARVEVIPCDDGDDGGAGAVWLVRPDGTPITFEDLYDMR